MKAIPSDLKFKYLLLRIIIFTIVPPSFLHAQYFTKITTGPLVNTTGDSRSVNWIDANNDGLIDCFISNGPQGGQNNNLFINNGGGNFTALTNDSLVLDNAPSDGATWADADNDGDLDCFVVNWYNVNNLFYLNNGNATFTKVSTGNLVTDGGYSETASWGDYDKDGLVDLYVTNSAGVSRNFLYRNIGFGAFTKITTGSIVTDAFTSRSVNWTDINNDGNLDVFVSNENNQNENIYRNDGQGVFTKLTTGPLLNDGKNSMSSSWGDYDNDGDMDVFIANDQTFNTLFTNDGNFNFTKIIGDTVTTTPSNSFSSAWSDVDNDGDLDLFVTNAFAGAAKMKNYFYINNGNGSFIRNSTDVIANDSSWSYGCAFGDYDNDGFEDLAVATCRFNNFDEPDFLYHNNGNSNHWITIKLNGVVGATTSNLSAIGTKIRVKAIINGTPVWQMREISAQTSYCGQNDLRAHFGLGNATTIDSVIVEWTNHLETFTNISTNQFISITELSGITNVEDNNSLKKNEILIFPNPATTKITIKLPIEHRNENFAIKIFDSEGALIFSANNEKEIDISGLAKGNYTIEVSHMKKSITQTFIKY